jgi:hypothetical protein
MPDRAQNLPAVAFTWRKKRQDEDQTQADSSSHIPASPEEENVMSRSIRRIVLCAALLCGFYFLAPATAQADDQPNMQDYNTYWNYVQNPTPPNPNGDYNTYWAQVQALQQSGQQP